jgi:riboflavin kinase/FMN adenylyltransferase
MIREVGFEQMQRDDRSMVTVGTFDGVHRGHQHIIRYLIERAQQRNLQSVVITFDPHPREVVTGEPVPLLTTLDERADVMAKLGLDRLVVIPFTPDFSKWSSEAFIEHLLVERVGLAEVVVGYDHGFGHNREGNHDTLAQLGTQFGFSVHVIPAQTVGEVVVSSTKVRNALVESGDVAEAYRLLGWYYTLSGTVVHGDQRGRTIGFPTANLVPIHPRKILPREGVYAVQVTHPSTGRTYGGMMNLGWRPTLSDGKKQTLEVNLFDFSGDLYGDTLRVAFVERLRNEQAFKSVEALQEQLGKDQENCKKVLKTLS